MGRSLESYGRKPLDADVEKDGAYEINWDDDTFSALFTEEELAELHAERDYGESDAIRQGVLESMQPEPGEELYDAQTLEKATRGVPIQDTLDAAEQDKKMKSQYKELVEIAEAADLPNPELEKRFAELAAEMEGIF